MKKCRYKRNLSEWMMTLLCGGGLCIGLGFLFYRHILGVLPLLTLLPLYTKLDSTRRQKKFEEKMCRQFKDALQSMTGALQAGYSLERAVPYAAEELARMYQEQAPMVQALRKLIARLGVNETVEQAFTWLAEDTGLEDIQDFVQVLSTTKRTGGNLIKVMLHTTQCMAMKQEVMREIQTQLSGKRLEANLMNLMPLGILLYLWVGMPTLVAPLYHNPKGILLMTVMLLIYGGGYLWTQKILHIKV